MSHELRTTEPAHDRAADPSASADDPLARARARGEQAKRDLLAAQGEMLSAAEIASRLRVSVDEVTSRRERGLLLALPRDDGRWGFPSWQLAGDQLLPGLDDVLHDLTAPGPWSRLHFLQGGDPYLDGQTPLDLIRRGEIDRVRRLAAAYDELVAT